MGKKQEFSNLSRSGSLRITEARCTRLDAENSIAMFSCRDTPMYSKLVKSKLLSQVLDALTVR